MIRFLHERKYELLLVALVQHLFSPALFPNLSHYTNVVWPANMVVLGALSMGVFVGRSPLRRWLKVLATIAVILFPMVWRFLVATPVLMVSLSAIYACFFLLIFVEVMRHVLRPSYVNADLVSAAICGLLLILETATFLMQAVYYAVPNSFHGVDSSSPTSVYLDLVYFSSMVVTTIGFGDISPTHHVSKLLASLVGVAGQLYSVVQIGILISKYTAAQTPTEK